MNPEQLLTDFMEFVQVSAPWREEDVVRVECGYCYTGDYVFYTGSGPVGGSEWWPALMKHVLKYHPYEAARRVATLSEEAV